MDLKSFVEIKKRPEIKPFRPGDTVRVSAKVVEGERERTQTFEGVVIRSRRAGHGYEAGATVHCGGGGG